MRLFADRLSDNHSVGETVLGWKGDPRPSADSVPLRLAGGLHGLKLQGKALGAVYPPHETPDDDLWAAVHTACLEHREYVLDWLTRPPQTNEVRRSGVLLAAFAEITARYPDRPVRLFELGASGGLNLWADHYALVSPAGTLGTASSDVVLRPKWEGTAPPLALPKILSRQGVDLAPLDPARSGDQLRYHAYIWPDQPERLALTEAALKIAGRSPATIDTGDAAVWLETALANRNDDTLSIVFHTVAWQYFPQVTKDRATHAMARAASPVVQIGMEADASSPGAGVTLTHWPMGNVENLARADFHGRWIIWH